MRCSRRNLLLLCLLSFLPTFAILLYLECLPFTAYGRKGDPIWKHSKVLPTFPTFFRQFYAEELALPQHNRSLPFPEGENGRFLWIQNQSWGLGWNNIFQELYITSLIAYLSNRSFVLKPYMWHYGPELTVEYYGRMIPSRIPLTAILAGPLVGGSFPDNTSAPRAVSREWHERICTKDRTVVISIAEMNKAGKDSDYVGRMDRYVQLLRSVSTGCVTLTGEFEHPFDYSHFGSPNMLSLWPLISESPHIRHFAWSPLVNSALRANARLLSPGFVYTPPRSLAPDLLAVHIRRGDYDKHCEHLATWEASFMGLLHHPDLPSTDRFESPSGNGEEEKIKRKEYYMRRCWPSIEQIVGKIEQVRREWESVYVEPNIDANTKPVGTEDASNISPWTPTRRLRRLYIMTNANPSSGFLIKLKERLLSTSGPTGESSWDSISSLDDLALITAQSHVTQAIDAAIGERATVFIGNGFSSLTSNVVMLRMARGLPMDSNRFW